MSLRIRNNLYRADWLFVREACCLTGDDGAPIEASRRPFFGEQWVGAYEKLRPDWGYLAEDGAGERLGYLTGCPDTERFRRERRWLFDLPLYVRARLGEFAENGDRARFLNRFAASFRRESPDRGPEEAFPEGATREVWEKFPAHLHMNLLPDARGKGVGRLLVERYREDLSRVGVRGIHLYCGAKPLPFYEKIGFREIDRIEFRPKVIVYRLGSRF